MLIITLLNHCLKFNSFVFKTAKLLQENNKDILIIDIVARRNGKMLCSKCRRICSGYDRLSSRLFSFIPIWGIEVRFRYRPRRVHCPDCGVIVEYLPWAEGKSHLTNVFKIYLAEWAKHLAWNTVAKLFYVQWHHVYDAVEYVVKYGLKHRCLEGIKAIGVDEIQYLKGHKYLTLVYQIDSHCRRLLYVGKDRMVKSLLRFFYRLGKARSAAIQVVCSDMWRPFLKAIRRKAPQAIHILDKFHISKLLNDVIDSVRRKEKIKLEKDGHESILKHSRWCLLKNRRNQKESQLAKLKTLLKYNLKSVKCMLLRESFQKLWEYHTVTWARKFLAQWLTRVKRSRIPELKKAAETIEKYQEKIFNWFRTDERYSNSIVEGFNNKAKLAMRKAYGFKCFGTIELALYHQLGALPTPPTTHRFL
jgi:transposase